MDSLNLYECLCKESNEKIPIITINYTLNLSKNEMNLHFIQKLINPWISMNKLQIHLIDNDVCNFRNNMLNDF